MTITCVHCGQDNRVPDDKTPTGGSYVCGNPACKRTIWPPHPTPMYSLQVGSTRKYKLMEWWRSIHIHQRIAVVAATVVEVVSVLPFMLMIENGGQYNFVALIRIGGTAICGYAVLGTIVAALMVTAAFWPRH